MVEKTGIVDATAVTMANPSIGNTVGVGDLGQVDGVGVDALVVEHASMDGNGTAVHDGGAVHVGVRRRRRVVARVEVDVVFVVVLDVDSVVQDSRRAVRGRVQDGGGRATPTMQVLEEQKFRLSYQYIQANKTKQKRE